MFAYLLFRTVPGVGSTRWSAEGIRPTWRTSATRTQSGGRRATPCPEGGRTSSSIRGYLVRRSLAEDEVTTFTRRTGSTPEAGPGAGRRTVGRRAGRRAGGVGQLAGAEAGRLGEADRHGVPWRRWGPYLSERQWGTVREDYSDDGDAWKFFPHDQARSRAYRWGEDGLAGICDDQQRLCFALALWNGRDPILKERLFGLTNAEGNHGEDVKEYYFYLDSTPTHSYMKYPLQVPAGGVPVRRPRRDQPGPRQDTSFEYELLDTGVFDGDRYFDVVVEYAKAAPEDLLVRITVHNRGPEPADAAPAADAAGSATPGRGGWTPDGPACSGRRPAGISAVAGRARGPRHPLALLRRATCRCCSPRTRPTPSGSSAAQRHARTSRTGSTGYVVARRDRRGEPGPGRHQGRGALPSWTFRAGGSATRPAAAAPTPTPRRAARSAAGFDELIERAHGRGRRVLRRP